MLNCYWCVVLLIQIDSFESFNGAAYSFVMSCVRACDDLKLEHVMTCVRGHVVTCIRPCGDLS